MDLSNDIRRFLVSRRARITPEQAGLPDYGGTRRVPGLRREEVALLAGISVEYYTRLERGTARGVSDSVLEGLTRALQLDEAERAHLSTWSMQQTRVGLPADDRHSNVFDRASSS
jgi:transcriptional regulator with XRE-family HTH domain